MIDTKFANRVRLAIDKQRDGTLPPVFGEGGKIRVEMGDMDGEPGPIVICDTGCFFITDDGEAIAVKPAGAAN